MPEGHGYPSCPGEACSRFKENKYDLKKGGDLRVSEGHGYPLVYLYNILGFVRCWSSFPSIRPVICPVIRPSKFLIPEEEDDGTGGGQRLMAVATVYPHIYVILLTQFVLALWNYFCCVWRNLAERAMEGQRWRYEIVQTLIVDIEPDETIKQVMNEINAGEQTLVFLLCPFVPCSSSMLNWLLFKI